MSAEHVSLGVADRRDHSAVAVRRTPLERTPGGVRCRGCGCLFDPTRHCSIERALFWHLQRAADCRGYYAGLEGELVPDGKGRRLIRSTLHVDRFGGQHAVLGVDAAGQRQALSVDHSRSVLDLRLRRLISGAE